MKVSVLIPSFNHEPFVAECIQSVLDQSYANFELIIVDDGSTDKTWEVIQKFSDARIRKSRLPKNMGACYASAACLQQATGEFICMLNSDDRWKVDKLEKQVAFLKEHPKIDAVFGLADYIDDDGNPIKSAFGDVFNQKNKTRAQWLRHFFFNGNCLCHPTIMIRKECYETIGRYDNRFRQLPDFKMWINFIKRYSLFVMQESLIDFRVHGSGGNTSAPSPANVTRVWNEIYILSQEFFDGINLDLFYEAFRNDLKRPDRRSQEHMQIEQSFLYLGDHPWFKRMYHPVGLFNLYRLLGEPKTAELLKADYDFDINSFHQVGSDVHTFYDPNARVELSQISMDQIVNEIRVRVGRQSWTAFARSCMRLGRKIARR